MIYTIEAETDLVAVLLPRLRRRARRLMRNAVDADDIVQDTLVRLLQVNRRQKLKVPEAYAMIVLQNIARERWRSHRDMEELDEDVATTPATDTARLVCGEVTDAIDRLNPDQARLMREVMRGETSPQALADATGCPVGTVMSRLARARGALRTEVGISPSASVAELF